MLKELSVVIPAYNEEDRIAPTLEDIASFLRKEGYRFEILVLNDGSTDTTAQKVLSVQTKYPEIKLNDRKQNRGKGWTIREGVELVSFPYTLFMDADNSTTIHEWPKFERAFDAGARAVSASRHLRESSIVHHQPFSRQFLGSGYRVICRSLFGLKSSDFNCGMKAYETPLAKKTYGRAVMKDWTFDVEIVCYLKEEGVLPVEVPVRWEHCQKPSSLKPFSTAIKSLQSLAALKKHLSCRKK